MSLAKGKGQDPNMFYFWGVPWITSASLAGLLFCTSVATCACLTKELTPYKCSFKSLRCTDAFVAILPFILKTLLTQNMLLLTACTRMRAEPITLEG